MMEQNGIWDKSAEAKKGKFLKKNKLTLTEEIMQIESKKPAPVDYQFNVLDKHTGREKYKTKIHGSYSPREKRVDFLHSAEWQG